MRLVAWILPLLLSRAAVAESVLLHPPDQAGETLLKAVRLSHRPESDFAPFTLEDFFSFGHVLAVGATLELCPSPEAGTEPLAELAKQGRNYIRRVEYENAEKMLRDLDVRLVCDERPVDAAAAADLYFLRGFVAFQLQNLDAARESFRRACILDPKLGWDNNYPPDAAPLFYEQRDAWKNVPGQRIRLLPEPGPGEMRIDGEDTQGHTLKLRPGPHLVEFLGRKHQAVWLHVESGESQQITLVLPQFASASWLEAIRTPDRWRDLDLLLATAADPGTPIIASVEGRLYETAVGQARWKRIHDPYLPARVSTFTGGALVAVGGVLAGVSWTQAMDAIEQAGLARTPADYQVQKTRYRNASGTFLASEWVLGAGALAVGAGTILYFHPVDVHLPLGLRPSLAPLAANGVGLQVTFVEGNHR